MRARHRRGRPSSVSRGRPPSLVCAAFLHRRRFRQRRPGWRTVQALGAPTRDVRHFLSSWHRWMLYGDRPITLERCRSYSRGPCARKRRTHREEYIVFNLHLASERGGRRRHCPRTELARQRPVHGRSGSVVGPLSSLNARQGGGRTAPVEAQTGQTTSLSACFSCFSFLPRTLVSGALWWGRARR